MLNKIARVLFHINNKSFQRLFKKNCIIVILCICLPLIFTILIYFKISNDLLVKETNLANNRALSNTSASINSIRNEIEYLLNQYMISDDVELFLEVEKSLFPNFDYISISNSLINNTIVNQRPQLYYEISLYSIKNNFIISSISGGQTTSIKNNHSLLQINSDQIDANNRKLTQCIPKQVISQNGNPNEIICFYRLFTDTSGITSGIVSIDVSLKYLTRFLTEENNAQGTILIIDQEGEIIFDSSHTFNSANYTNIKSIEGLEKTNFHKAGESRALYNNDEVYASWIHEDDWGWTYVQLIPNLEYNKAMGELSKNLISIFIPTVFASILIALYITKRLFKPLEKILRVVEQPESFDKGQDDSGEIQFLLYSILDSFQRNITLEEEIVIRKSSLRHARVLALQKQIGPHFLNNVLQSINLLSVMETGLQESATSRSIVALSDIISYAMDDTTNLVELDDEISHLKKYMEIARLRYGDRIIFHYDIDWCLSKTKVIKLLIQPLIENSVEHGIHKKNDVGNIYLSANYFHDDHLVITVEDNGIGMSKAKIEDFYKLSETDFIYTGSHLGLINLTQRIKLVYGDSYGLTLSESRYGGLKVEIIIPIILN